MDISRDRTASLIGSSKIQTSISPSCSRSSTPLSWAKTFAATLAHGGAMSDLDVVVYSKTLRPADYPDVTVVNGDPVKHVQSIKARAGKDSRIFGGGALFRTFVEAGVVDTVESAVVPVLLGGGIPMLPAPYLRTTLALTKHSLYQKSGIMLLE
jgi:dihydrofolate reductase